MYKTLINNASEHAFICEFCGRCEDVIESSELTGYNIMSDYNTLGNSAAPVYITGPNSYTFQKKLICNTSNYKKQQKKNTIDQLESIINQYQGPKFPKNIIKITAEFYYEVQQHKIMRGNVRKGVMAACLYRVCIVKDITRKPKEISIIFNIEPSELSNGEKILDELFAGNLLKEKLAEIIFSEEGNMHVNQFYFKDDSQISSFLSRYFECLSISDEYFIFCERLVSFTIKYRIAQSSIISSKCAGAIHIVATRVPELEIMRGDIERECQISKSTFGRFSQCIFAFMIGKQIELKKVRSRMRHLFKKNNVPII
jgi:hypothetical protein